MSLSNKPTTIPEIISALQVLRSCTDEQATHEEADDLLRAALVIAGHAEVVAVYDALKDQIPFWYS